MDPKETLKLIRRICGDYLGSCPDMLLSSKAVFDKISELANSAFVEEEETIDEPFIGIYCDASVKKNPGGPSAVSFVISDPGMKKPMTSTAMVPSITISQAEYDAIYMGLTCYVNLINRPRLPIRVFSDSELVINQLNGIYKVNDPVLSNKLSSIAELVNAVPTKVTFHWLPRNSTPELKQANNQAQSFLGIKNH